MNVPRALARKAIADVTHRKGRTALVILGIFIGVLGLTAVNFADDLMGNAFAFRYSGSTLPDLAYNTQNQAINPALLSGVQRMANVSQVLLRTEYDTQWLIKNGSGYAHLSIMGNPDTSPNALGAFQLTSGHLPGSGEIVMESSDSTVQPFSLGTTITINNPGGGTAALRVVGLARTPGNIYQQNGLAYMRPDILQHLAHLNGPNDLLVKLRVVNQQALQQANAAITNYLRSHGLQRIGTSANGQINTSSKQVIVSSVFQVIRVVSLIALLLACFLLINTINTLITEQIPFIGTMKALGGQRWIIMCGYLISVGVYSCAGTAIGIALGMAGGIILAQQFAASLALNLGPLTFSPWVMGISLLVGLALPPLAALVPLVRGTRITVHQAIAAYGVSYTGWRTRAVGHRLLWVSQTTWLGLRGLFRKPTRAMLTLLALTLSAAVFLSVQTTTASIGATLDVVEHTYSSEVTISVNAQPYHRLLNLLGRVPNVARIEPQQSQRIQISQMNQGQLDLIGLEPDTQLYQRHLVAGRWLATSDVNTLVLSDVAAGSLGLQVGDQLRFVINHNLVQHWSIVGIVHDLNKDPGNTLGVAYTGIQALNALNHAPADLTSNLLVRAHDRSPAAVDRLAKDLYAALVHAGIVSQVTTLQQQIQQNQGPAQVVYAIFDLVSVIVALVGILGLFSTLSSSVLERRLEIGVLRSLGASNRRVAFVFLIEGLAFAVLAWLIGVILGVPGAYGLIAMLSQQVLPLDFFFNPLSILGTLGFLLLIVTLASVSPALMASHLRIRELLRYE